MQIASAVARGGDFLLGREENVGLIDDSYRDLDEVFGLWRCREGGEEVMLRLVVRGSGLILLMLGLVVVS